MKTRSNTLASRSALLALIAAAIPAATSLAQQVAQAPSEKPTTVITIDRQDADVPPTPTPIPQIPADFDHSGMVNAGDVFAYLEAWMLGRPYADTNGNGVLEIADIYQYLNLWFANLGPVIVHSSGE